MTTRAARLVVFLGALAVAALTSHALAAGERGAQPTEQQVYDVASRLRCVVCQNLSVADSPSEMAGQMRAIVRQQLATGKTPEQVVQYFVDRYGEWILLAPPAHGFTLLVWLFPVVAVLIGLTVVGLLVRRWVRQPRVAVATPALDAATSERIRREMEKEA